ncbi:MAG: hypothetical protein PUJ82_12555 [Spirochaetales bacterium]|nr:hypothetical protein [Spirochaetales bacterium]
MFTEQDTNSVCELVSASGIMSKGNYMNWFNIYGFGIVCILMIPNIIYAKKCPEGFENLWQNKVVVILEQVGRFGSFAFMIFNIPGTCFGFESDEALAFYLIVDGFLLAAYCIIWDVCFWSNGMFRAVALSVIPSVLFLFSGVVSHSILLIIFTVIFAPMHILISCKNARAEF